jgi:hypothetical protein
MDLSKFKTSDWLKIGGGAGVLIFGLLPWISYDTGIIGTISANAFDLNLTGILPWLLLVAAGVITFLLATGTLKSSLPWPLILLAATGLGALLIVFRLLAGPPGASFDGVSRGIGLYVSTLAAIASAVGGFLGFKESGGDLNDLKDVNKLKAAFDNGTPGAPPAPPMPGGGDMPPPPPPPSMPS